MFRSCKSLMLKEFAHNVLSKCRKVNELARYDALFYWLRIQLG